MRRELFILRVFVLYVFLYSTCGFATVIAPQKRISLNFQNAPVQVVLQALADYQNLNLIISDEVKGTLSIKLDRVPWQQAMELVLNMKNLNADTQDNIMFVFAQPVRADSFRESIHQESLPVPPLMALESESIFLKYSDAVRISALLKEQGILSPYGKVLPDPYTNTLLVRDSSEVLNEIKALLILLDKPQPQIQITAHIVTISSESLRELGVSWSKHDGSSGQSERRFNQFNVNLPVERPAINVGFHIARLKGRLLDLELSALEQENQVEIIASPRLITTNQQQASIKQGSEIPYEVSSGTSGATAIEFKEAVLGMEVTPRILNEKYIEMALLISQNMPGRTLKRGDGEALAIDKQEIRTQVAVADGETIVLGGIFQKISTTGQEGVPLLRRVPLLGGLFRHDSQQYQRRELVIFITPKLMTSL